MIICRTPLRISFVGGGTDLPSFYEQHGGAVVSATIDKWINVIVARRLEGDVRVSYSQTEIVPNAAAVEHELVREAMRLTGVPRGVEVVTGADRSADAVLRHQKKAIEDGVVTRNLEQMRDLAFELRERLLVGDVAAVGSLLRANWELKRAVASGISNDDVDRWYESALNAGATGAKLLGAGAGGFFLAFAPLEAHERVRQALSDIREVPVRFTARGTQITF